MSYELNNPKQSILDTFSSDQIHAFFVSTRVLSGILGFVTFARWVQYSFARTKFTQESAGLLHRNGEMS